MKMTYLWATDNEQTWKNFLLNIFLYTFPGSFAIIYIRDFHINFWPDNCEVIARL